jgi:hypothetical protein
VNFYLRQHLFIVNSAKKALFLITYKNVSFTRSDIKINIFICRSCINIHTPAQDFGTKPQRAYQHCSIVKHDNNGDTALLHTDMETALFSLPQPRKRYNANDSALRQ